MRHAKQQTPHSTAAVRGPARCRAAARRAGRCAGVRPRPMCVGPARRAATGGGAGIQIGWAMAEMWHVRCECIARRSGAPRALAPLSLSLALFFSGYITVISIFVLRRVVFFTHLADTATSVFCTVALAISMRKLIAPCQRLKRHLIRNVYDLSKCLIRALGHERGRRRLLPRRVGRAERTCSGHIPHPRRQRRGRNSFSGKHESCK